MVGRFSPELVEAVVGLASLLVEAPLDAEGDSLRGVGAAFGFSTGFGLISGSLRSPLADAGGRSGLGVGAFLLGAGFALNGVPVTQACSLLPLATSVRRSHL